MAYYFDSSALVKLIVNEDETAALKTWISAEDRRPITCDVARAEVTRAVRRAAPGRVGEVRGVLNVMDILELRSEQFDVAGSIEPPTLRTVDAIHLAAALDLGDDLEGFVTYDSRLAEACEAVGIQVFAPH
ncbi:MAG: type II toxin-antitoxin system VapC family toxin [Acidimicrobiia bacterium]